MDDLISRQAAIDALLHNQDVYSNNFGSDPIDRYTIAIIDNDAQTIAQLPSAQPEQTTQTNAPNTLNALDCISRQEVLNLLTRCAIPENGCDLLYQSIKQLPPVHSETCEYWDDESNYCALYRPSAQPERKTGHWIKTARWGRVYYCDQCRNYLDFDGVNAGRGSTNFCPNCGAEMKGASDE